MLSFPLPAVPQQRRLSLSEGQSSQKVPATFKDRLVFSESFQVIITSLSIETLGTNLQLPSDG